MVILHIKYNFSNCTKGKEQQQIFNILIAIVHANGWYLILAMFVKMRIVTRIIH